MTTPLIDKSMPGLLNRMNADIALLFRRIGRPTDPPIPVRGSTAERDAAYPTPTTDAERAALANRQVLFFNTDTGWEESYYAVTGTPGLIVRGLVAGTAPGWYPTGMGPRAIVFNSGPQAAGNGTAFTAWAAFGTDGSFRNDSDFFEMDSGNRRLLALKAGRYAFDHSMNFPVGTGTGVYGYRINNAADTSALFAGDRPIPLLSGYGQVEDFRLPDVPLEAGAGAWGVTVAASWLIGGGASASYLSLAYLGPNLTTD